VVTRSVANSPLTSKQRRVLEGARRVMGEGAGIRVVAIGRANARWSDGARWTVGIFSAAFVLTFVILHVILVPGALVVLVLYDSVRPKRGVAVTAAGISELKLSLIKGRPSSVITSTDHAALFVPRLAETNDGKSAVAFGSEVVSLRGNDLAMLQAFVPAASSPLQPGGETLPPPPPTLDAGWSHTVSSIPRWREATLLWVIGHIAIGLGFFVAILVVSNAVGTAFGRDIAQMSGSAGVYLFAILAGAVAGWMLFVYHKGAFRTRVMLLSASVGGALLVACIVTIAYSPAGPS
jgi:hypothetical protein